MKKITQLIIVIAFTSTTVIFPMTYLKNWFNDYVFFWKTRDWHSHFQRRLYQEPRPLLMRALEVYNTSSSQEKKALDLGAGAGNETAFLLQKGWIVWSNDREQESIEIISNRKDVLPYKDKLTLIHKSFTDIPWDNLPLFNLICAIYTLPFIDQNNFHQTWNAIVNHLEANGILAVSLFGDKHDVFGWWEKRSMSFFTREEVLNLLKNFDIKFFTESCEKNDEDVMEHIFSVVAQKK
ncbi:MAG TPA: class I SAM-dependent methyltransferase [Candidatus Babeliales bacterium]|nr:class I SAM-dependent methyltransferase [Candidatus Babeliales bacterium]